MSEVVLLVALPLLGAGINLLGKVFSRQALTRWVRLVGALAIPASAWALAGLAPAVLADGARVTYALGGWPLPVGITLGMDGLAWVSSAMVLIVALPVTLTALGDERYDAGFFFFLLILLAGMQMVIVTDDLFTLFVAFEIVAIAAYVLIAYEGSDTGLLASLKYLFLSSVGILFFLFGVLVVYRVTGSLSLTIIGSSLGELDSGAQRAVRLALSALVVGVGVRTAFIPFHTWLPEAHAYAPHPISALLSGALIKVSLFALVRLVVTFGLGELDTLFLWVGAGTALVAVVWALAQHDIKRLLAYHSISQMGFILAAFGAGGALGIVAATAHAFNHALFKSLLFLGAGAAIPLTGSRNLYHMKGLRFSAPAVALALIVGSLSIAGVPPFNGFASKGYVSAALYGSPAYLLLQIAAVGTAASFIKVGRFALFGSGASPASSLGGAAPAGIPPGGASPTRPSPAARASLVLLSLSCLVVGLVPGALWRAIGPAVAASTVEGATFSAPEAFTLRSVGIAVATAIAGVPVYLAVVSAPGRRLAHRISAAAPDLGSVLALFLAGLAVVATVGLLG